jgi:short-subunit dehydrogenase
LCNWNTKWKIENINSENLFVVKLDLTNQKSIENVNKIIRNKFKGIDVLVNNAGIGPDLGKREPDLESLKLTLKRTFSVLLTLLKLFRFRK